MVVEPLNIINALLIIAARMTCAEHAENGVKIYLTNTRQLKEEVESVVSPTKCH